MFKRTLNNHVRGGGMTGEGVRQGQTQAEVTLWFMIIYFAERLSWTRKYTFVRQYIIVFSSFFLSHFFSWSEREREKRKRTLSEYKKAFLVHRENWYINIVFTYIYLSYTYLLIYSIRKTFLIYSSMPIIFNA